MKLVVGLGNPGPEYAGTRHNAGFLVVERFAAEAGIALGGARFGTRFGGRFGQGVLRRVGDDPLEVAVLEPGSFMNRSGGPVAEALGALGVEDVSRDLLIAFDDVDLPFARLRLRPSGGSGGHRGLASVIDAVGRHDVPWLRFGVGRPPDEQETRDHVLERFRADEAEALDERLGDAARAIEMALFDGVRAAMDRFNAAPAAPAEAPGSG